MEEIKHLKIETVHISFLNLCACKGTCLTHACMSAFRPRGVPGPTSKLSPRVPAQMGRRETEHEGGKKGDRQKGKPAAFVLSCA
jgi:hypothetical protein